MDKSWIELPRNTHEYLKGVDKFIDFALEHRSIDGRVLCPCVKCKIRQWLDKFEVKEHLLCNGFLPGYVHWVWHGEGESIPTTGPTPNIVHTNVQIENPEVNIIHDAFAHISHDINESSTSHQEAVGEEVLPGEGSKESKIFIDLLEDGNQDLYDGCSKYSKLSFLLKLYHIKCLCGISNKAMSMIFELLKDAFEQARLPDSYYEAKKTINKLSLNYDSIHACPNDCMLYWGDDKSAETCKVCNTSRWKQKKNTSDGGVTVSKKHKKKPAKVLRYFPLKPRLQRLFMSSKIAEHMRWHGVDSNKDGLMRHPRDSEAWKQFNVTHAEFAADPRNIRLGLAADGFNPFGNQSSTHSTWPVILIPYNLPPWMCMKQTSFILSMIIPGKKMPGNDIDIYLQPLIKELNELWRDGVETFDASQNEFFRLRAALLWTLSDFPGLGNLSGWNTYTGLACPSCNFDFLPHRLSHSRKWCFMGHRRFLEFTHRYRHNRSKFDGNKELRNPPKLLSGSDIFKQLLNVNIAFGKKPELNEKGKRSRARRTEDGDVQQWKKKSIFFQLPYWEFNLLRHNLDVMHIEKNVFDNILYTLLNDSLRSKDNLNARKDLQSMGIREDLWPNENGKYLPACFTLTNAQKDVFLATLENVLLPDGCSSNISRCVDLRNQKIHGLKSHDCHIIMEHLLPIAIRNLLPNQVCLVLVELCSFFKQLCARVLNTQELDNLQRRLVLTLCHMEMVFPPSFFTVMVHLVVHLVDEVKLGGPVPYRWMYSIERYLGHLKSYVRNRAQPEGSIAEGYIAEECLTFCSRYLEGVETRFNRHRRVNDEPNRTESIQRCNVFQQIGRPVSNGSTFQLTDLEKQQAHRYVLMNCGQIDRFIDEFKNMTKRRLRSRTRSSAEIQKIVNRDFASWFAKRIMNIDKPEEVLDDIKFLARGPLNHARRFSAYNINGLRFRTVNREEGLKSQNSGVFVIAKTPSVASSRDIHGVVGDVAYYGKLVDIIELNYYGRFVVTLFKCIWADTTTSRGIRRDNLGFTEVNFSRGIHGGDSIDDEPYVLAIQAQMVFYVTNALEKDWSIAIPFKPRDFFDMGDMGESSIYDFAPVSEGNENLISSNDIENLLLTRDELDDEIIDAAESANERTYNINNMHEDD